MKIMVSVFLCMALSACTKLEYKRSSNIQLGELPFREFLNYINGPWKMHYKIGGMSGRDYYSYPNAYVTFYSDGKLTWINKDETVADCPITWVWGRDLRDRKAYLLLLSTRTGVPFSWSTDRIYNDTLMIEDMSIDGYTYYLTRQ